MLTERKIYMFNADSKVREKSNYLFNNNLIKDVSFNKANKTLTAKVYDEDMIYTTKITFDNKTDVTAMNCTCRQSSVKPCEHMLATLHHALLLFNTAIKKESDYSQIINEIISNFYDDIIDDTIVKQPIVLVPIIKVLNEQYFTLSFKVGTNKLYIVKNIKDFIKAFITGDEIEYGKHFTLNPDIHTIDDDFKNFFELISEIYYQKETTYFSPKELLISEYQFKMIIATLTNQCINIEIDSKVLENVYINDDKLDDLIMINDRNDLIELDLSRFQDLIAISKDYRYIIDNHELYTIDKVYAKQLKPFFKAVSINETSIIFKGEYKNQFISKVIPCLPQSVEIPESIQKLYIKLPLQSSLYLDKTDDAIIVKPSFKYGNYEFNPLNHQTEITLNNKILLREIRKEEELMNIFDSANFKVQPSSIYIDNEDDMIEFIEFYLPILSNNMTIYYSDSFKTIIKRSNLNYSIKYNDALNIFDLSFNHENISGRELLDILQAYRMHKKYHRLKDGSFIALDDLKTKMFLQTLDHSNISLDDFNNNSINVSLYDALFFNSNIEFDTNEISNIIGNINETKEKTYQLEGRLKGILRDYQTTGYQWLKTIKNAKLGGILADDMGLGKTLQTIAFLESESSLNTMPNLIVCPSSLIYNWEDEIKKFAPNLSYAIITGDLAKRNSLIKNAKYFNIILTSYPLLKKDINSYQDIEFNNCFIDEAQYIKNIHSKNARSVKMIKANTRFALTGTPIENSLSELWSIFDFVMPGFLLSYNSFKDKYERPIVKDNDEEIQRQLINTISPFILRRMKTDVLDELPDKIEKTILIELDDEQKQIYLATLEDARVQIENMKKSKIINQSAIKILSSLTRLRQLCNHPSLFIPDYYGSSSKVETLLEIIKESIENKQKVLVFSQFTSMLHIIESQLNLEEIGYKYLDGQTPVEERTKIVNSFNNDDTPVFLVSLKAGGTGLNLTSASVVIHVDPWWNPAVEQQATDRAYRIGQTKNVQVIKLISKGTIEEKINYLQQSKLDLIDSIIKPGESFISKLSTEEIIDLFK